MRSAPSPEHGYTKRPKPDWRYYAGRSPHSGAPCFSEEGGENMKSKEVLLLAVCLMAMAPVAQAQLKSMTADPHAQSFNGFYNLRMKCVTPPSSEPAPQRQQSQPKAETKPPQFDNEHYQFGLLARG